MGERTELSDECSAENEAPKSKPPDQLKNTIPRARKIGGVISGHANA